MSGDGTAAVLTHVDRGKDREPHQRPLELGLIARLFRYTRGVQHEAELVDGDGIAAGGPVAVAGGGVRGGDRWADRGASALGIGDWCGVFCGASVDRGGGFSLQDAVGDGARRAGRP